MIMQEEVRGMKIFAAKYAAVYLLMFKKIRERKRKREREAVARDVAVAGNPN
jgi:hypothetical protein